MATDIVERWAFVPGFGGDYSVSTLGRVRSEAREVIQKNGNVLHIKPRFLRPYKMPNGYLSYYLRRGNKHVGLYGHRMVLTAFVGDPEVGHEACHGNGVRDDNRLDNLRWDTRKNNFKDKNEHGTSPMGERHPQAKLTEQQVLKIRDDPRSSAIISREYGISFSAVCSIRRKDSWKHIP